MISEFVILMQQELLVTALLFLLILLKLGKGVSNSFYLNLSLALVLIAGMRLFLGLHQGMLFAGLFVSSKLIIVQKTVLLLAVFLLLLLNYDWLKRQSQLPELLVLLFASLLGFLFLVSSGNLLLFYLSLELATIPVAALVNFDFGRRQSSEAAMKMILSSAFASGILLFGISLLYGVAGTLQFSQLPLKADGSSVYLMGFLFVFSGLAFKLSVVPFHFWTADVYEGGPAPVSAYLSVISKAAVSFVLVMLLYRVFPSLGELLHGLLVVLSLATLIVGNLFALRQQNLKRFLAFSSVAQVGFILLAVSSGSPLGTAGVVYFMLIYAFSNLSAFAVIATVAAATGRETLDDYQGLYKNNKLLSWVLVIALFSLAGIPPTAGFFAKLFLILAGALKASVGVILVVVLNMVVSLYYYLRVVKAVFSTSNAGPLERVEFSIPVRVGMTISVAVMLVAGLVGIIYEYILSLS